MSRPISRGLESTRTPGGRWPKGAAGHRSRTDFFDERVQRACDVGPRQRTSKHRPASPRGGFGGAPSKGVSNGCVRMGSSGRIFDWTEYVTRMAANLKSRGDPRRNWGLGNKVPWVHSSTRYIEINYLILNNIYNIHWIMIIYNS